MQLSLTHSLQTGARLVLLLQAARHNHSDRPAFVAIQMSSALFGPAPLLGLVESDLSSAKASGRSPRGRPIRPGPPLQSWPINH